MNSSRKFLIEGLDRLGKNLLIAGIQNRLGYHAVIHCSKPMPSDYYTSLSATGALRLFQEDAFRTMFSILQGAGSIIYNRAHLGECVYAPLYRGYSGSYVFDLENEFCAPRMANVRLVLLTENFDVSKHFQDDGKSLGPTTQRRDEQHLFVRAFTLSRFPDKRMVNVTDAGTGGFRAANEILDEVLT